MIKDVTKFAKKSTLYGPFKNLVLYRGALTPKIMFIGESPDKEDDLKALPFTGRKGKLVDAWIRKFNLKTMVGMMYCVPYIVRNPIEMVRKPTLLEIDYFRPYVHHMLEKYKSQVIILLGGVAAMSVLKTYVGNIDKHVTAFKLHQMIPYKKYFTTVMNSPEWYVHRHLDGLDDFATVYSNVIRPIFPDLNEYSTPMEKQKTDEEEIKDLMKG